MRPSSSSLSLHRSVRFLAFVLAVALAGFVAPAGPRAAAAPAQAWIGQDRLQELLDASPTGVPGHFVTALGGPTQGQQAPKRMPLTVLSIVADAGPVGDLLLVRLDLSDPDMARIGNIASGMSGSPVVVDDGGPRLVGALSYGDIFTTDGLALATPIGDMLSVEAAGIGAAPTAPSASTTRAIPPVRVDGRSISRLVVAAQGLSAKDLAKASASTDASTAYFTPLLGLQIGGLPAQSTAYRRLESKLTGHGLRVLAPHGGGAAGRHDSFAPDMVPGASAGTLFSVGDLNVGAVGTVTYTTANHGLVAFGHPLLWMGPTEAFFTSAWIDGVWTSTLGSYKLATPGQVLGTFVQDRGAGVGARLDKTPVAVPVTASATVTTGGRSVTRATETRIAPGAFSMYLSEDLPASAAVQPIVQAADIAELPGSATTRMTVVVTDGVKDYTITRANRFYSDYDIQWDPGWDVYETVEAVLGTWDGKSPVPLKSIDLSTQVSTQDTTAEVEGIYSTGLRTGKNTLSVAVRPAGATTDRRIPVTLTIPPGMPLTGSVTAFSGGDTSPDLDDDSSLASTVAALNAAPVNSDIVVRFRPEGSGGDDDDDDDEDEDEAMATQAAGPAAEVRGIGHTSYVITGEVEAATSRLTVEPSASPIVVGEPVVLSGSLQPTPKGATVKVERRTVGSSTWRTIAPAVPVVVEDDESQFQIADRPQFNSIYRVSYAGSAGTVLGSSASVGVQVKGRVAVAGTRAGKGFVLTASVTPRLAGATVTFKRLRGGHWRKIATVTTSSTGQARYVWRVKKGTYKVRAVLSGSALLARTVSPTIKLKR